MQRIILITLVLILIAGSLSACSSKKDAQNEFEGLSVKKPESTTENEIGGSKDNVSISIKNNFEYEDNGDGTCTITGYAGEEIGDLDIPGDINGLKVTAIGDMAFYYRDGFTGCLTIPEGVTTIGNGAFWSCTGLTGTLTIPESVITIEGWAFNYCKGLTGALIIPNNVTSIGREAFAHNSFAGSLIIPESVTTIGNRAFVGCSKLTQVEFSGNAPVDFGGSVFYVGEKNPLFKRLEITYDPEKSGWSTPEWNGYPCYPKNEQST